MCFLMWKNWEEKEQVIENNETGRKCKQEQLPRKAHFLSDVLGHNCNRETLENKVSLTNAQDAL